MSMARAPHPTRRSNRQSDEKLQGRASPCGAACRRIAAPDQRPESFGFRVHASPERGKRGSAAKRGCSLHGAHRPATEQIDAQSCKIARWHRPTWVGTSLSCASS